MARLHYNFSCPNCSEKLEWKPLMKREPKILKTLCCVCYYPLTLNTKKKTAEVRVESIKKKAFLIHSSKPIEKSLLDWFRRVTSVYGVRTFIIEDDIRTKVDWLQKSVDWIKSTDFVLAFLTKRYQFMNEKGQAAGWKAPDKCYDEIAMSFALGKDILALVEKEVDFGRVLENRMWCHRFEREPKFKADVKFFENLDLYAGN